MKKLTILLLGLLSFQITSQATVFVYKHTITGTDIGAGFTTKLAYSGFTVSDDNGNVTQILVSAKAKSFFVWQLSSTDVQYVKGTGGVQNEFIINDYSTFDDNGYEFKDYASLTGPVSSNLIDGSYWTIAKSFTWSGFSLWFTNDGQPVSETTAGKLTLDLASTNISNTAHDTVDAAIYRLKQSFILKGYREQ